MNHNKPVCFVVSPIGSDESEIRQNANDFLELLVQPALEKFNFEVIRADKISRPTFITTDIVRLVQESELCIIDLTGHNPNVFYECGRRHESGKAFVQMVSKAQEGNLPFDVSGIRTVTYDLSSPRAVLESQKSLQLFAQQIVDTGFGDKTSGDSLSSVAKGIERLDRKLSILLNSKGSARSSGNKKIGSIEFQMMTPDDAWRTAINEGRMDLAYQALDRLKQAAKYSEYFMAVGIMASFGEQDAFVILEDEIEKLLEGTIPTTNSDGDSLLSISFQFLNSHFINRGKQNEGIAYTEKLLDRIIINSEIPNEVKATLANKIGMLAWTADQLDCCLKHSKMATELDDTKPSYFYNLSIALKKDGQLEAFEETLVAMSKFNDLDEDHIDLLNRNGIQPIANKEVEPTRKTLDDSIKV